MDASIIGAAAVTLATSYAFGDVFGLKHSLHRGFSDAKQFYLSYTAMVVLAGGDRADSRRPARPDHHRGAGPGRLAVTQRQRRHLLAGTCFSLEPGIYLPQQFGVRLEYDIYLEPHGQMRITGGIQKELVTMRI